MYIKSIKVDGLVGSNLDSTLSELKVTQRKYNAEEVWCTFNTHRINSNMTVDDAYNLVLGKTKYEFDEAQRKWREDYEREEREFKDRIPELTKRYIEKAKGIISDEKLEVWNSCVPIRLSDLYRGFELDCTLKLVKMLDIDKCDLEEAKEELDNQGHSGMSYGLEKSMIREFCIRADEFLAFIE